MQIRAGPAGAVFSFISLFSEKFRQFRTDEPVNDRRFVADDRKRLWQAIPQLALRC
jgi:hypothetical protein